MKKRDLRSGYTTGATAASAAKAAALLLFRSEFDFRSPKKIKNVEIPFPDGKRITFSVNSSKLAARGSGSTATASVIKDAGDDPDVTNGAEIVAEVRLIKLDRERMCEIVSNSRVVSAPAEGSPKNQRFFGVQEDVIHLCRVRNFLIKIDAGKGVGRVTKPGLSIPVGEAAINPVPRRMIRAAVAEAIELFAEKTHEKDAGYLLEVIISVPEGERIAKKTLNSRLGIIDGISILGTTGIVKPLSAEAWTASITASMDVARALGHKEVVLSSGRSSEKAHMKRYDLPVESYVMMGDYIQFSLLEAKRHGFEKIHLCTQWAKMIKISMATPQTHVRHGALEIKKAVRFLDSLGYDIPEERPFNTSREVFQYLKSTYGKDPTLFKKVCIEAARYAGRFTAGIPVISHLVSYEGEVIVSGGL